MKTLFISRKYPPMKGGMESYCFNLINNYNKNKKVIVLGKKQIHLIWFLPYCFIYVLLYARKYDILYLGDMLMSVVGWGAKIVNPKIKVVSTVHGLDITYTKKIYQLYLKCFSYKADMYVPNSSYTEMIANEKGYHSTKVIYPATLTNEKLEKKYQISEFRKKYELNEKDIVFITTGRLVKRKGVAWFIENVLPQIKNYKYLVAGDGIYKEEIEKVIKKTNNKNVKLLGRVSDEDIAELYYCADVFVMPNIDVDNDVEGYGMVAVEAAANKCIVVASDLQGINDAVVNGLTGYLVKHEDKDAFVEKLEDIIANLDQYKKKTENAYQYVYNNCTGKAIAREYEVLFESILREN